MSENLWVAILGLLVGATIGGYGYYRLLDGVDDVASYVYCAGGPAAGLLAWYAGLGLFA
jgi:hypothetical protein